MVILLNHSFQVICAFNEGLAAAGWRGKSTRNFKFVPGAFPKQALGSGVWGRQPGTGIQSKLWRAGVLAGDGHGAAAWLLAGRAPNDVVFTFIGITLAGDPGQRLSRVQNFLNYFWGPRDGRRTVGSGSRRVGGLTRKYDGGCDPMGGRFFP